MGGQSWLLIFESALTEIFCLYAFLFKKCDVIKQNESEVGQIQFYLFFLIDCI